MFAVIKTGGKQYRVSPSDVLTIERIQAEAGTIVTFDEVLMLGDDDDVTVGAPQVEGAAVAAEVVEQARGPKVIIFKKKRRQKYRRKNGHRQNISIVRITEILTGGAKPSIEATGEPRYPAYDPAEKVGIAADDATADVAPVETAAEAAETLVAAPTETAGDNANEAGTPAQVADTSLDEVAKADAPATAELEPLFEAPEGKPDDLKKISGVGKVIEGKLHALGIKTYAQVAGFSDDDIARVDAALSFKGRIARENWVEQAKALAAGTDEEE